MKCNAPNWLNYNYYENIGNKLINNRIFIVQAIWDSIAAEQVYPDLSEQQKKELDSRINDSEHNPENILTWEEIKTSITRQ